jgi:Domain of unknown function (DUF4372)
MGKELVLATTSTAPLGSILSASCAPKARSVRQRSHFSWDALMHVGKLIFAQLTEYLPLTTFRRCVARYGGDHKIKRFTCLEQFLCLAFAQLTYRESLRDIEACLRAHREKLYHMGSPEARISSMLRPVSTSPRTEVPHTASDIRVG